MRIRRGAVDNRDIFGIAEMRCRRLLDFLGLQIEADDVIVIASLAARKAWSAAVARIDQQTSGLYKRVARHDVGTQLLR